MITEIGEEDQKIINEVITWANAADKVFIRKSYHEWHFTGSYYICPEKGFNDIDLVVYACYDTYEETVEAFEGMDFTLSNPREYKRHADDGFYMFRKGNVNLIVTNEFDQYRAWVNASIIAKALKLTYKHDRVTLFHAITGTDMLPDNFLNN